MSTSVITSRIREDVKIQLENESKNQAITLNTLISQILSKHVSWDKFAEDVGFVLISMKDLEAFLESIPKNQIEMIARTQGKDTMKNSINFIQGEINFENFIKTLELWLSSSNIPFRQIMKTNATKFIIQHELGNKWALYILTLVEAVCNDMEYKIDKKIMNNQSVSFEIKKA